MKTCTLLGLIIVQDQNCIFITSLCVFCELCCHLEPMLCSLSLHVFLHQLDADNEALRGRLRAPQEKIMYTLVPVPDGMDISSIFELDPTTLRGGDSMVPRYNIPRHQKYSSSA